MGVRAIRLFAEADRAALPSVSRRKEKRVTAEQTLAVIVELGQKIFN